MEKKINLPEKLGGSTKWNTLKFSYFPIRLAFPGCVFDGMAWRTLGNAETDKKPLNGLVWFLGQPGRVPDSYEHYPKKNQAKNKFLRNAC